MATIKDVAREANVSLMTVSRVINTPELVKEDTIKKVNEVIERLKYRPNLLAKGLAKGKSKTIGIISSNMYNQAYTDIISSIEKIAYQEGFVVIKVDVETSENAKQALNMLLGNKVDGIVLTPLEMKINEVKDYKKALEETYEFLNYFKKMCLEEDIKVVTVSQKIEEFINVDFDYNRQATMSMNYLINKGYKDISLITGIFKEGLWHTKENVYRDIMIKNNLKEYINVSYAEVTIEGGKKAAQELFEKRIPKAIYCGNDLIASGAIQAILENGFKIPTDIAVIGNDDMYLCDYIYPKLTSIGLGAKEAGRVAIEKLLKLLNNEVVNDLSVNPYLIERKSI